MYARGGMGVYPGPRVRLRGLRGLGQDSGGSDSPLIYSAGPQPAQPAAQVAPLSTVLQSNAVISQDPLSYASPQAAIAAGLDQARVMQSWTQALAQFPTRTAAVNAGIPAAVVTLLFDASRAYVAQNPPSWFDQTTLGVSNGVWLVGGLAAALALIVFDSKGAR